MYNKVSEWVLTDDDSAQHRRRLPDVAGQPVFELAEVHQYGDTFRVGHGRIVFAYDLSEEDISKLCAFYGVGKEDYPDDDWAGILAEMAFETSATEYDSGDAYDSITAARAAVMDIVSRHESMEEATPATPELSGDIQTIGQFCAALMAQYNALPDSTSDERRHLALATLASFVKEDPILRPAGMCFHLSNRINGRLDHYLNCDIPAIKGSALEYSPALSKLPQEFTWRKFITIKKSKAKDGSGHYIWKVTPTEASPDTPLQLILIRQLRLTELLRNAGYDTVRAIGAFFTAHNISEQEQHRLMAMVDFLSMYRPNAYSSSARWAAQMLDPQNRAELLEKEKRESRLPAEVDRFLRSEVHFLNRKSNGTM